jgi:hypothetical protein
MGETPILGVATSPLPNSRGSELIRKRARELAETPNAYAHDSLQFFHSRSILQTPNLFFGNNLHLGATFASGRLASWINRQHSKRAENQTQL